MNVVNNLDLLANRMCQIPLFVANLLKIVPPVNWASVSSTLGSGWNSRNTSLFKGFKLTHIRISPEGLGTTTIPAHHGMAHLLVKRHRMTAYDEVLLELGCAGGLEHFLQ